MPLHRATLLVAGLAACAAPPSATRSPAEPDQGPPQPVTDASPGPDAVPDAAPLGPPPGYAEALALARAVDRNPDPRIVEVDLEAREADVELLPGVKTRVWTYGGTLPGPLIEANVGDRVIIHLTNRLPEDTILHTHGVRLPNAMDGSEVTQAPIPAGGGGFTYDYVVPDAGLYWYHPHLHSNAQLSRGLYGPLLVRDPAQPFFGDEAVLVLDDVLLLDDGQLAPPDNGGHLGDIFGREGNVLLVNGRVRPEVPVRRGRPVRWYILNAGGARYFRLGLGGLTSWLIGSDGGLLEHPVPVTDVLVEPAARADVVVVPNGAPGERIELPWLPFDRGNLTGNRPPEPLFDLRLTDEPAEVHAPPPPDLRVIDPVYTVGAVEQTLVLGERPVGGRIAMTINDVPYPPGLEIYAVTNTVETWTIANDTDAGHPFHLHGFFFQVLDVTDADGMRVPSAFRSWRDTVHVPGRSRMRIAIPFDDRDGHWMFHCHILDHAEIGMMGHLHLHRPDEPVP
ncbi:multicopper oxidase family protein [Myxococcota bacterium]|nr:multicopper oxidase family protein [Myxococcota bacterium]